MSDDKEILDRLYGKKQGLGVVLADLIDKSNELTKEINRTREQIVEADEEIKTFITSVRGRVKKHVEAPKQKPNGMKLAREYGFNPESAFCNDHGTHFMCLAAVNDGRFPMMLIGRIPERYIWIKKRSEIKKLGCTWDTRQGRLLFTKDDFIKASTPLPNKVALT